MKKAWKWGLVLVGMPLLGVAILWVDTYHRAVSAIRAEDERLARDIAAFRSRQKPLFPVDASVPLGKIPCPASLFRKSLPIDIEDGKSGQVLLNLELWKQSRSRYQTHWSSFSAPPPRVFTIEEVILALAVTQEALGACGYAGSRHADFYEDDALNSLSRPLTRPEVTPPQFPRLAVTLDQLLSSRRTIAGTIEAEYLLDRSEVLRVLHRKDDPTGFITHPPGWKEFFSWRILIVKCLKELDAHYREARMAESAPLKAPVPEAKARISARTASSLLVDAEGIVLQERQVLARWQLARVATAFALFQQDRRQEPKRLDDLVPRYLPAIPANPLGDEPLRLEDGLLRAVSVPGGPELVWPLRR